MAAVAGKTEAATTIQAAGEAAEDEDWMEVREVLAAVALWQWQRKQQTTGQEQEL